MINSDLKIKWLRDAEEGKLQDMKEIYQQLKNKGLQHEVKNFKDSSGFNALMCATGNGHLDICQLLVRDDLVDVNEKNKWGGNALHFAAMNNRPEIAKFLLEETSIDANAQTNDGRTALHSAANLNYPEVARILLKYKPRLLKSKRGKTPLDVARRKGRKEIVLLLKTNYNS